MLFRSRVRPLPPSEKSRTDGSLSAPPIRSKSTTIITRARKSLITTEKAATARTPAVRRAKERTRTVRKRNRMCSVRTTTARTKAERTADVRQDRTPITRKDVLRKSRRYPTRISAVRYRAALLQVRRRTSRCTQRLIWNKQKQNKKTAAMRLLFFYFADNLAGAAGKEKQREKDCIKTLFFAAFLL